MLVSLVILVFARAVYCFEDNSSTLHRYMTAFSKEIECLNEFEDFDDDVMLSVAMTIGQLNVIEHSVGKNGIYYKNISSYNKIANEILEKIKHSNKVEKSKFTKLANPRLWEMNKTLTSVVYEGIKQPKSDFLPEKLLDYFDEKSRTEPYKCTEKLMEGCTLSDDCLKQRVRKTYGYNTIDQVLYWQVFRQLGCRSKDRTLNADFYIHQKCLRLFLENSFFLLENKLPDNLYSFFLDSVGRCGIETALEFLFPEYKERVLYIVESAPCSCGMSAASPGLHGYEGEDCSNHFRAVRLSTLAVQLRDLMNFSNF